MQTIYELAPVIANVIAAQNGPTARGHFLRVCVHGHFHEARSIIEGVLAEPEHLRGHQETRLREFLELMPLERERHEPAARLP
jgi:hypothetical protein